MTTEELVRINKDYFIRAAGVVAKTTIFAAFPYSNVAPINLIINQALSWLIGKIADSLELAAFFSYVDMRVDQQGKDYVDAAHAANTNDNEDLRRIADEKFKAFVHFNSY